MEPCGHVLLDYKESDVKKNKHMRKIGISYLIDIDLALKNIKITNRFTKQRAKAIAKKSPLLHKKYYVARDDILHLDYAGISELAMQRGMQDFAEGITLHCERDMDWHSFLMSIGDKYDNDLEKLVEVPITPEIRHLMLEKIGEQKIIKNRPDIRRGILWSFVRVLPEVKDISELLADHYQDYNVSARSFSKALKFGIGLGMGNLITGNYAYYLPKFGLKRKEKLSIMENIFNEVLAQPYSEYFCGLVVPINSSRRIRNDDRLSSLYTAYNRML